jgi:asparagine synthase (glutamine-hydrolysing)
MSGIFGIIRLPGATVADVELAPMAETLKHRGPDGINYFARDNAGLGHCMLQSTPESLHETLPFRDEAAGLTITADARIDNREQLMADIPVRASNGQVITDSQLILHAYSKWGEGCVDHLLGDFVFAIWNERTQALFVARDHMGCKPFYYHCHHGLFVFASSAMAVARVPEVKATLNEGRVADYLVQELEGINKTCSWYNEISRMPPAQCGHFRNNTFQYRQYWTLEPADLSHLKTDEDYLEAFTEVYTEAVRCRLRCQTEPASMLSGGLDSSTIVALARNILFQDRRPPLQVYSAISDEKEICPETQSIRAIIAQGNVKPRWLQPSDLDGYSGALACGMASIEDPFDGLGVLLAHMFLMSAKGSSRVLLGGLDGEHAVGAPTNYITQLLREGKLRGAWNEAQGFSQHYYRGYYSAPRLFIRSLRSVITPSILRLVKSRISAPLRYRNLREDSSISTDFAREVDLASRVSEYDRSNLVDYRTSLQGWHKQIMQVPYLVIAIERYERLGSYFGVEARHPLLDIRLLELSNALPLEQKAFAGWSKFLLRRLAIGQLPDSVVWREGWEQLGWKFALRRARKFAISPGFPIEDMSKRLALYTGPLALSNEECVDFLNGESYQQLDYYRLYRLYSWLNSSILKF